MIGHLTLGAGLNGVRGYKWRLGDGECVACIWRRRVSGSNVIVEQRMPIA